MLDSDSEEEPEDVVKLWEDGWKERYYCSKFGVPPDDRDFLDRLVCVCMSVCLSVCLCVCVCVSVSPLLSSQTASYTRGLCWVFGYYYQVSRHNVTKVHLRSPGW